jgi:hypothetical protein
MKLSNDKNLLSTYNKEVPQEVMDGLDDPNKMRLSVDTLKLEAQHQVEKFHGNYTDALEAYGVSVEYLRGSKKIMLLGGEDQNILMIGTEVPEIDRQLVAWANVGHALLKHEHKTDLVFRELQAPRQNIHKPTTLGSWNFERKPMDKGCYQYMEDRIFAYFATFAPSEGPSDWLTYTMNRSMSLGTSIREKYGSRWMEALEEDTGIICHPTNEPYLFHFDVGDGSRRPIFYFNETVMAVRPEFLELTAWIIYFHNVIGEHDNCMWRVDFHCDHDQYVQMRDRAKHKVIETLTDIDPESHLEYSDKNGLCTLGPSGRAFVHAIMEDAEGAFLKESESESIWKMIGFTPSVEIYEGGDYH